MTCYWTHKERLEKDSLTLPHSPDAFTSAALSDVNYFGNSGILKLRDNTGIDWAKDVLYGPAGEMTQIKYTSDRTNANYHTETRSYNSLLQLTRLTVPG